MENLDKYICNKPGHKSPITGLCIDKNCKLFRFCCLKCATKDHYKHIDYVITFNDLNEMAESVIDKKNIFNRNDLELKIKDIFEDFQTILLDEINMIKQKVINNFHEDLSNNNFSSLREMDEYIKKNIFVILKKHIENSDSTLEELDMIINPIIEEFNEIENINIYYRALSNFDYIIPSKEERDDEFQKIISKIRSIERLFNNYKIITKFYKSYDSDVLIYNDSENSYSSGSSNNDFSIYSDKLLINDVYIIKFRIDLTFSNNSGFGLIDERILNGGNYNLWPEKSKCCYLNISSLQLVNMRCNQDLSNLKFVNNNTDIILKVKRSSDYFGIFINELVIIKNEDYSIKDNEVRIFFFIYRNGMKKVYFLN
jgi:hypothetical protein